MSNTNGDTREALAAELKREAQRLFDLAEDADDMAHLSRLIDRLAALTEQPAAPQASHLGDSVERCGSPSGAVSGGSGVGASDTVVPGFIKPDNDRQVFFYEQDFYVLSNFSAFTLLWRGRRWDTSEAAYHSEKFPNDPEVYDLIRDAPSAHEAFKIAEWNKAHRRPDWDDVKVGIMRDILRAKAAQHEYVRRKLLATGDRELIEDSWRDDFWGWGPNRDGKNMLGRLWMEVRAELRDTAHREARSAQTQAGASVAGPEARPDQQSDSCAAPQGVQAEPVADAEIKALYVAALGSDLGWMGLEGSYFIAGVRAGRAATAAPAQEPQQPATREARLRAAMDRMDRDGPLPGMISAFEAEFGGDWTDPSWRQETAIWASAWRRAASSPAPAVQPTEAVAELVEALQRARDVIEGCDYPVDTSIDRALAKHGQPQGAPAVQPLTMGRIYEVWHEIGADVAGLSWAKFAEALQHGQPQGGSNG